MHSALVSTNPPKCWECVIRNCHLCCSRDQSWGHSHMNPWIFTWWLTNCLPLLAVLVPIPLRPVSSHHWYSSRGSLATVDLMTCDTACSRYGGFRFGFRDEFLDLNVRRWHRIQARAPSGGINSAATEAGGVKISIRRRVCLSIQVIIWCTLCFSALVFICRCKLQICLHSYATS